MTRFTRIHKLRRALLTAVMVTLLGVVSLPAMADDAKILKKDEAKNLIIKAKTAQDHQRLADHFAAKAAQFDADAQEHEELATKYKANPGIHEMKHPGSQQTASHCTTIARSLRDAAKRARQLAEDHQAMAKEAK